jgi:hypothetical protein
VRLQYQAVALTVLVNGLLLSILLYRVAFTPSQDQFWWACYAIFVAWLCFRARRLKRRVADLVIAAAQGCGLARVFGASSKPAPEA